MSKSKLKHFEVWSVRRTRKGIVLRIVFLNIVFPTLPEAHVLKLYTLDTCLNLSLKEGQ